MVSNDTIIITGVTGQDGSYLATLLVEKGYRVIGTTRSLENALPIMARYGLADIDLIELDLNEKSVRDLIESYKPRAVCNFSGQTYVGKSWLLLNDTLTKTGVTTGYFLDAIAKYSADTHFVQASSSEIFYPTSKVALTEEHPMMPINPYGCAKVLAHNLVNAYQKNYGIAATNLILFPHESPRRGEDFLIKKVITQAQEIVNGDRSTIKLGNIDIVRDWGDARDFMDGVTSIIEHKATGDFIMSGGNHLSVAQVVQIILDQFGLSLSEVVAIDHDLVRSQENPYVVGDSSKIFNTVGWKSTTPFTKTILDTVQGSAA